MADLTEAISSLATITNTQPLTAEAALAWGRIADCYYAMGSYDAEKFADAISNYSAVVENPCALPDTRSEARFKIGDAMEKQAQQKTGAEQAELLKAAFSQYLSAFYQGLQDMNSPSPADRPSPFWIEESGMAAGKLAETLPDWPAALRIYSQLKTLLPVMANTCDRKIAKAIEHGASP